MEEAFGRASHKREKSPVGIDAVDSVGIDAVDSVGIDAVDKGEEDSSVGAGEVVHTVDKAHGAKVVVPEAVVPEAKAKVVVPEAKAKVVVPEAKAAPD